ncbi:hypothetical protein LTR64_002630 [Lithohypha guttulata]|uniref:uncharacterized protein n=1 Tax=Lithohypha guttulata TaxID=1690604 RepID=UPI002DDE93FD|nr:hypothetical protein LTR51_001145 [Lithohypha guttulata]
MATIPDILPLDELSKLTRASKAPSLEQFSPDLLPETQALWQRLLLTVHSLTATDKHMTAACNAICFTARKNSNSLDEKVRVFAFSGDTFLDTFLVVRSAFAAGKNKPALQVLDTIAYLANSNRDADSVGKHVAEAAAGMVRIVYSQQPKKCLKEACIVLYFFLRKLSDFMSFPDVLRSVYSDTKPNFLRLCRAFKIDCKCIDGQESPWLSFVISLLMVVHVAESKSATLKLLSLLCTLPAKTYDVELNQITREAVAIFGAANETSMNHVMRDVIPSIVSDRDQFHALLPQAGKVAVTETSAIQLILAQLNFGKTRAYLKESDVPHYVNSMILARPEETSLQDKDSYDGFRLLLKNVSPAIRQSACELLISSTSSQASIQIGMLRCLRYALPYLHDDIDAFYRGEMFSIFRRFVTRLYQHRPVSRDAAEDDEAAASVDDIDDFLKSYTIFLKSELAAHLSYGRHILSLEILCFISQNFTTRDRALSASVLADSDAQACLFRLLLDPYDDVRAMAAKILSCAASAANTTPERATFDMSVASIRPVQEVSRLAARTNRADHADALGRTIALLKSDAQISSQHDTENVSQHPLLSAAQELCRYLDSISDFLVVSTYPLHGNVLGIAYAVQNHRLVSRGDAPPALLETLLASCRRIWLLSQTHLCVDSPEVESDSSDTTLTSGPKDSLAYAWRALRDANVLMQSILEGFEVSHMLIEAVGDMCFEQLRLLRHRGAFSTVSQTFLTCCQKARSDGPTQLRGLTDQWFDEALKELEFQADKLTRRSAGLPAIFAALLDPSSNAHFSASFEALVVIASQSQPSVDPATTQNKLRLPQVHALNCIKDIMTNSRFRTMTEPVVVPTINLAAQCMSSSIWAIKNCGLMLLRASINRLDPDTTLGAAEAGMKLRGNFAANKTPLEIAVALLGQNTASESQIQQMKFQGESDHRGSTEALFAGLDLLSRLYITDREQGAVKKLVEPRLGHHLWHIRAQAARLLAHITLPGEELSVVRDMLSIPGSDHSTNSCHGRLLAVHYLLKRLVDRIELREHLKSLVEMLLQAEELPQIRRSTTLKATWLGVWHQLVATTNLSIDSTQYLSNTTGTRLEDNLEAAQPTALYARASAVARFQTNPGNDPDSLDLALKALQTSDDDAVVGALVECQVTQSNSAHKIRLEVFLHALRDRQADDVRALGMSMIASIVTHSDMSLGAAAARQLVSEIGFGTPVSRDLMLSQLKLYTSICAFGWKHRQTHEYEDTLTAIEDLANAFCLHLRAAANEEHDDSTRHGALQALLQWRYLPGVDEMTDQILGRTGRFEILSILYDFLNDDDEMIRSTASTLAAKFYRTASSDLGVLKVLSAAASRDRLRQHMKEEFLRNEMLSMECLRRLIGLEMTVTRPRLAVALRCRLSDRSVQDDLQDISEAATDLFAEEKQNLYLDEVAEIKAWAETLCCAKVGLPVYVQEAARTWISAGVQSLDDLFSREGGIVDMGHNTDLEMLLSRLVVIGRLVGGREEEIDTLKRKCCHLDLSNTVLSAFTWSLQ